ncbi:alpha/beta hydrolase [Sporolactobacillus shoreae]|uniref:Alpha/beta hydrolase n=1 Tax=Sporolactobacillus shoreae TaxID=1465501 RepID=A0A4Z0GSP0_9BACL|nr:alpha/beta hydrolase [Sporolactobacillus shoreae]TGA99947.1 alpha/beta hydrolase [Sporolactobacillus shoreae]
MASFTFEDYKLNYHYDRTISELPTIVLIHDLGMDQGMWRHFTPLIKKDFNILTYDFYGHGKSTDGKADLSLDLLVQELTVLLRHLQLDQIHLLGCRYGAIVAFEFALSHPGTVDSLTLLSMPLYVQKGSYSREASANSKLITFDKQLFEKRYILQSIHPVSLSKSRTMIHALRSVGKRHFIAAVQGLNNLIQSTGFDLPGKLKCLRVPTLFLHGEYDPVYPASLALIFSGYAPNSRFALIPDASALIPLDQPRRMLDVFRRFMIDKKHSDPLTPEGINLIGRLNALTEKALNSQAVRHHNLQMSVMDGTTQVFFNGQKIVGKWMKRNAQGLLLFLIMNHGAVKRDMIIDAFTPNLAINQARVNLRVQLNYLNNLFRSQPDPEMHDLLIISRDSVALNAKGESDIRTFFRNVEDLQWAVQTADERGRIFLSYLEDYHPDALSTFSGEWPRQLETRLRSTLSRTMAQILLDLRDGKNDAMIRRILKKGKVIEPYDGFCKSWTDVLNGKTEKAVIK